MINNKPINWSILGFSRFILSIIVVFCHLSLYANESKILSIRNLSGFVAVVGFLFISGYSIAHSINQQPKGYFIRRFLRIVPLYWISFGFSIAVAVLCYGITYNISGHSFQKYDFADAIKNMFFLQGIFCEPWTLNIVVWTISIEVFFYTLAPWLKKLKPVVILGFIIFSAASFILWRYIGSAQVWQLKYGLPMLLLAWSWLAGYWIYIKNTNSSAILLICSIGFFALAFHNVYLPYLWPITFLIPIIALAFSGNIYLSQTTTKLFDWMGDISYPIYLFHIPIFSLLFVFSESNKWYVYIICMIAITAIIDALLDKPLKKFLKNVFLSFAVAGNPK